MTPIVKHPGGKRRIALEIFEALGRPPEICEPFAGGLAVSLIAGARPAIIAEKIPVIRALYATLAFCPAALWSELEALPSEVEGEADFLELRERFNRNQTPGLYVAMIYACFNGVSRFNRSGGFNASVGAPLPRQIPRFSAEERLEYERAFAGAAVFSDWRPAIQEAARRGVPVYADPPYVGTFAYAGARWTLADLGELARALPPGSLLSERIGVKAGQPTLLGHDSVKGLLEAEGFELAIEWTARNSVSRGERTKRAEGVWRKRGEPQAPGL